MVPEYNGGFPGVLKLVYRLSSLSRMLCIKCLYLLLAKLRVRLVHCGRLNICNRSYLTEKHSFILSECLSGVDESFDREKGLKSDMLQGLLEDQLNGFIEFVGQVS